MVQLVDTIWANGLWADTVWADGVWAGGSSPVAVDSTLSGGGRGAKRHGRTIKFNGQFYDSVRDQLRLSRDVEAYNRAQEKPAEPVKTSAKPTARKQAKASVAQPKAEQTPQVDYQSIVNSLKLQDAQNTAIMAMVKARMAEIEEDDLEVLLLS